MTNTSNPFVEFGLANIQQFKQLPFVELPIHTHLKNRIRQVIGNWEGKTLGSGDWIFLIADKGAGKTTSLYCLHDYVKNTLKYPTEIISALPTDKDSYKGFTHFLPEELKRPLYLFIDFPDRVEMHQIDKFLTFIESCMRSEKYYELTKFVLAMNQNHLAKCRVANENLMGKWLDFLLLPLTEDQTKALIAARLKNVGMTIDQFADATTIDKICKMGKGNPRTIMSYCSKLYSDGQFPAHLKDCSPESFLPLFERIIQEGEQKPQERENLYHVLDIFKTLPNYQCDSKVKLADFLGEKFGRGRSTSLKWINKLIKMGVLKEQIGGTNNAYRFIILQGANDDN